MMFSNIKCILIFLCAFVCKTHSLTYSDLEAQGVACPERDRCEDYRNNLSYMERNCECDFACSSYKDCCIDATRRRNSGRPQPRNNIKCVQYGEDNHTGVYAISTCSSNWHGPREVRQKCTGSVNLSDPLAAAPVVDVAQRVTYRNLYCAECNDADMASLSNFQIQMFCGNLENELTTEQIFGDITYNQQNGTWGVYRINAFGNATEFVECLMFFDVPSYLNHTVRFCRANIISTCAPDWRRQVVRRNCEEYMAVVYDQNDVAYRNPHCVICNHKIVDDHISCNRAVLGRKRPMSFALLLDVNQSDGDQVGMRRVATPECPSGHKYDPFFKKCRRLVCALPGHVVVDGRCVRQG